MTKCRNVNENTTVKDVLESFLVDGDYSNKVEIQVDGTNYLYIGDKEDLVDEKFLKLPVDHYEYEWQSKKRTKNRKNYFYIFIVCKE